MRRREGAEGRESPGCPQFWQRASCGPGGSRHPHQSAPHMGTTLAAAIGRRVEQGLPASRPVLLPTVLLGTQRPLRSAGEASRQHSVWHFANWAPLGFRTAKAWKEFTYRLGRQGGFSALAEGRSEPPPPWGPGPPLLPRAT